MSCAFLCFLDYVTVIVIVLPVPLIGTYTADSLINRSGPRCSSPALCKDRMAARMLAGGGDANTPPATAADSMPAPT